MKAFGLTDTGKKREKNEDSILINNTVGLFIVADGMGGHLHGEVASRMAVASINEFLDKKLQDGNENVETLLGEAVAEANEKIHAYSLGLQKGEVSGTTISLLFLKDDKIYIAHVGDSKIYRLRKGLIEKLTKDHSKAQELVDANLLRAEEADNHRSSHILTRAVGPSDRVIPDIWIHELKNGDRFLLSTDGLFRVVEVETVKEVLSGILTVEDKCRTLIGKALAGGAPDNVSVIIIEPEKKGFFGRIFS